MSMPAARACSIAGGDRLVVLTGVGGVGDASEAPRSSGRRVAGVETAMAAPFASTISTPVISAASGASLVEVGQSASRWWYRACHVSLWNRGAVRSAPEV